MDPVRALSFNVRYDVASDGGDAWPHRRGLVASTIRYHAPDTVAVQEAMAHQLRELEAMLDGYDWAGDPRDSVANGGEYTAIGYDGARFERLDTGTFWLSETGEPGSVGWDGAYPRIATWVRLRERASGDRLLVANTHLDHEGTRARKRGIGLVLDRLDALADGDPVVLSGDFNCTVGEPAHARADGHGLPDGRVLLDAREAADRRHGPTTTRTDFHDLLPERGIDHVFVSDDCGVRSLATAADRDDDHYASDHLPVVADVDPP